MTRISTTRSHELLLDAGTPRARVLSAMPVNEHRVDLAPAHRSCFCMVGRIAAKWSVSFASKRFDWALQMIEDAAEDPPLRQPEAFLAALNAALGHIEASLDGASV